MASKIDILQRRHFFKRIKERYEKEFKRKDRLEIIRLIQRQKSVPLRKYSNSKVAHSVEYNGITYTVIYSNRRKELITALPSDSYELDEYLKTLESDEDSDEPQTTPSIE